MSATRRDSSTRKYDNDGYHSDIQKMVTDFAGDMLCTYAVGREHDAFTNFEIPKAFKKLGIQLGHHLKVLSKKLDDYRKLVSNCVDNGTSYVRSLIVALNILFHCVCVACVCVRVLWGLTIARKIFLLCNYWHKFTRQNLSHFTEEIISKIHFYLWNCCYFVVWATMHIMGCR